MTSQDQEPGALTDQDRILLRYREAVARATARALAELRGIGVDDPTSVILGRRGPTQRATGPT